MSAPRALVIGAGPAGLAAAAALGREGVAFDWVDRQGAPGGAYRFVYGGMALASPARYSELPGLALGTPGEYVTARDMKTYFERYASSHRIAPREASVEAVAREGSGFEVRFEGGARGSFAAVVVATGMFDHPFIPSIVGLGAGVVHARDWRGPDDYKGKRLLIIGGGVSGVELAEEAARAGVAVAVSAKGGKIKTVPQRVLGRDVHDYAVLLERWSPFFLWRSFCARNPALPGTDLGFWRFVEDGKIRLFPDVARFDGRSARFVDGSSADFDAVVLATGYDFKTPFLPPDVARHPAGHPAAKDCESVSWPGLFLIGFPCARGLDSEFIRGMARDAAPLARRVRERLTAFTLE